MNKLFATIIAFVFIFAVLKILGYYLMVQVITPKQYKNKNKATETKRREFTEEDDKIVATRNNLENEYYLLAKVLLKDLLQNKAINRQQILYLKELLSDIVPSTKREYKNDMHEIYSKLKSPFMTNEDYKRIVRYLNIIIDLNY